MVALHNCDILVQDVRIIKGNGDEKGNYKKVKQLLLHTSPDGVFPCIEKLTFTTYKVCRDLIARILKDLKVICFSNLENADMLTQSIKTISQPAFEMGKQAANTLFKFLAKKLADSS